MDNLKDVIEKQVRPILNSHNGDISIIEVTPDGYVKVQLTGACATCPGAQQTLADVVEAALMEACPEIKGVIPVSSVSDELIDAALKILRKNREGSH